jgi:tRNA (cmo5U34)-methyltransferase
MFFDLGTALDALRELGPRTRDVLARLFPGPVSVLLPNPLARFPLACGEDPSTLGVRVVSVPELAGVRWPVLQSSANLAGGPDPRRLEDVPERLRRAAEMVIDGGDLPGTPSTVVDLRRFEDCGEWSVVRQGGMTLDDVRAALTGQYHFDPDGYAEMIRGDIPAYEELQDIIGRAAAVSGHHVLDLGTGTGETAARLLAGNPDASLVGVDESEAMLSAAAARLGDGRVSLHVGRLQDPLPEGRFDVVASALCVHHLTSEEKRSLFARVREVLAPGGRFVLGDVVVPLHPADRVIELTEGYDRPDTLSEQLAWLAAAGFSVSVEWTQRDLAVVVAEVDPPSGPRIGSGA